MKPLLKMRVCNNKFPVNHSRYFGIPRGERLCPLCNSDDIGDDFHYLFKCKFDAFVQLRKTCLKKYYLHHQNAIKYYQLMNSENISVIRKIAKLAKGLQEYFSII